MLPGGHIEPTFGPERVEQALRDLVPLGLQLFDDSVDLAGAGLLVPLSYSEPPLEGGDEFPSTSPGFDSW